VLSQAKKNNMTEAKKLTPVFIGGTGRSGTSVLKRVLSQHPHLVSIESELRLIIDPDGALDLIQGLSTRWSPAMADSVIQRFETFVKEVGGVGKRRQFFDLMQRKRVWPRFLSPRRYGRWQVGHSFGDAFYQSRISRLVDKLSYHSTKGRWLGTAPYRVGSFIRESEPYDTSQMSQLVSECFDDLYKNLPACSEATSHWVEDTPYNLVYADHLLSTFAGSRFIHVYRDPRDVLASYLTKVWGGDDFEMTARRLAALYRQWFRVRDRLPNGKFIEVGLEDLVKDPQGVLTQIGEVAGFPFDDKMLSVSLDRANSGRWREIPADKLDRAIPHLKPAMEMYGYSL
jgi:hypothetical protein